MTIPSTEVNTIDISQKLDIPEFLITIPVRTNDKQITSLEELFLIRDKTSGDTDLYKQYTDEIESIRSVFNSLTKKEIEEIHDIVIDGTNDFHPNEKKLLEEYLEDQRQQIISRIEESGQKFQNGELNSKFIPTKYKDIINGDMLKKLILNNEYRHALKASLSMESFKKILTITGKEQKSTIAFLHKKS